MRKLKYLLVIVQLFIIGIAALGQCACSAAVFMRTDRDIYVAGVSFF